MKKKVFYKRHKDQLKKNSHSKYSLITYLNDNWQEADGGQQHLTQCTKCGGPEHKVLNVG